MRMPEGGVFEVRGSTAFPTGARIIVKMDYGLDEAIVLACAEARADEPLPGFTAMRAFDALDAKTLAENASLAAAVLQRYSALAQDAYADFKAVYHRLSFGRNRLFLRYVSRTAKPNLSQIAATVKRLFDVDVQAWHASSREEVALCGAAGPCGRVCCCASFLKTLPPPCAVPAAENCGICGRRKCCLSFEIGE
ncbi:MAG: hypothetical protein IJ802_05515 [Kiritimatiellae bacterium]|nr:hypothetical protein [Kiritimatiellia bacterium]